MAAKAVSLLINTVKVLQLNRRNGNLPGKQPGKPFGQIPAWKLLFQKFFVNIDTMSGLWALSWKIVVDSGVLDYSSLASLGTTCTQLYAITPLADIATSIDASALLAVRLSESVSRSHSEKHSLKGNHPALTDEENRYR